MLLSSRIRPGDRVVYLGGFLGPGLMFAGTIDELVHSAADPRRLGCSPTTSSYLRGQQEEMW